MSRDDEFDECRGLWDERPVTEHSWRVPVREVMDNDFSLDIRNPASQEALVHRPPGELAEAILAKEQRIIQIMGIIRQRLETGPNGQ